MKARHINRILTVLTLGTALLLSGCVSKSTYDRDVAALLNQLAKERGTKASSINAMETQVKTKAGSLTRLTDKYMQLEREHMLTKERLSSFRDDLENLRKDVAELKLVVSTNIDKLRSTMANELLIKIIDMEYRVEELLRIESATPGATAPQPSRTPETSPSL
jgi:septal ring factor EnvC (AmiA/AmiB activator)